MIRAAITATVLLAALTGCTAAGAEQPETAAPTPTPEISANQEACDAFSSATAAMSDALTGDGNANDGWAAVRDDIDAASLDATGDVKDRLETLVDQWPKASDLVVYRNFTEINQALNDVGRACEADDAAVDVYTFVTE